MKKDDREFYLGFSYALGIGPMKFKALLAEFGDVKKAYQSVTDQMSNVIGFADAEKFDNFRKLFRQEKELSRLEKQGIHVIPQNSEKYPQNLLHISDPPICIFAKGNPEVLHAKNLSIAVVGTRKPTTYGLQATKKIVGELAFQGTTIISGLAFGIDAEAHKTALENDTPTIAVLGCGVNIPYPAANKSLYEKIVEKGVVISEFPPDRTVLRGLFISRNRIVSALSAGVLIVEGLEDSGALITARYAAEQGRDVFAVPSPITSNMSQAPHILLKQGAKLVTSAEDILEEYNVFIKKKQSIDLVSLPSEEQILVQILSERALLIDEIARVVDQPIAKILQSLSSLELKGLIEKNTEGKYQMT